MVAFRLNPQSFACRPPPRGPARAAVGHTVWCVLSGLGAHSPGPPTACWRSHGSWPDVEWWSTELLSEVRAWAGPVHNRDHTGHFPLDQVGQLESLSCMVVVHFTCQETRQGSGSRQGTEGRPLSRSLE